jgi:hypothetical protein
MGPILICVLVFNRSDHCKADICTSVSEKNKFGKMCLGGCRRSRLHIKLRGEGTQDNQDVEGPFSNKFRSCHLVF